MAGLSKSDTLVINGWRIFVHPLFFQQIENLAVTVERLSIKDPKGYADHRDAKVLAAILKVAFEVIPGDPGHRMFLQGGTLGAANRHWRRAKFFSGRYRLFFQFNTAHKVIVLAWVNDEETLRTYGKKTDAYAVFQSMLGKGRPPSEWRALLKETEKEIQASVKMAKLISKPR
jgi:toxin YhaV